MVTQVRPVAAQDPSIDDGRRSSLDSQSAVAELEFNTLVEDVVREGYFAVGWSTASNASLYEMRDQYGIRVYAGAWPQAFISGLADGNYEFLITAFDDSGEIVGTSKDPLLIRVEHWPLRYALLLFGLGLIVFAALVVILALGARKARHTPENRFRSASRDDLSSTPSLHARSGNRPEVSS